MLDGIEIFSQSSIKISRDKIIYFDPYLIDKNYNDADIIFITHSHYDHFSPSSIEKVMKDDTMLVVPTDLKDKTLSLGVHLDNIILVSPNNNYSVCGISFSTLPAYNINKPYHPRSNNWISYLINISSYVYYIAGDTDATNEAKEVKCDVSFVPVGGTYTMNYKEAVKLINIIKPKYAIPIHYKTVVGTDEDAKNFVSLLDSDIKSRIYY